MPFKWKAFFVPSAGLLLKQRTILCRLENEKVKFCRFSFLFPFLHSSKAWCLAENKKKGQSKALTLSYFPYPTGWIYRTLLMIFKNWRPLWNHLFELFYHNHFFFYRYFSITSFNKINSISQFVSQNLKFIVFI